MYFLNVVKRKVKENPTMNLLKVLVKTQQYSAKRQFHKLRCSKYQVGRKAYLGLCNYAGLSLCGSNIPKGMFSHDAVNEQFAFSFNTKIHNNF